MPEKRRQEEFVEHHHAMENGILKKRKKNSFQNSVSTDLRVDWTGTENDVISRTIKYCENLNDYCLNTLKSINRSNYRNSGGIKGL